jgi:ferrous iron transport protein A
MVLSAAKSKRGFRILNINAGHALQARLASMGLVPGVEFEVLANHNHGPLILALEGSRIMLGRGMAAKIMVA